MWGSSAPILKQPSTINWGVKKAFAVLRIAIILLSVNMSNHFNQSANYNSLNDPASRNVEGRRHSGFCVPSILIEDWSEVNFEETLGSSSRGSPTALKVGSDQYSLLLHYFIFGNSALMNECILC